MDSQINQTMIMFIDALKENTKQLVIIAENQKKLLDAQGDTNKRLYNGMAKEITQGITDAIENSDKIKDVKYSSVEQKLSEIKKETKTTLDLIQWTAKIATIVALVVSISLVVIKYTQSIPETLDKVESIIKK